MMDIGKAVAKAQHAKTLTDVLADVLDIVDAQTWTIESVNIRSALEAKLREGE